MLVRTLLALFALTLAVSLASPVGDQPVDSQQQNEAQLTVGDPQQQTSSDAPQPTDGDTAATPTDDLKTDASFWGLGRGYGGWGGYYRPRYYGYYRPRYYNPGYYGYGNYGGYGGYGGGYGGWGGYWG